MHHRKALVLGVVAVLLAILATTLATTLLGGSTQAVSSCDGNGSDQSRGILVDATVITVDTANQQAIMRLDFSPIGSLVDKDQALAQPLDVTVQGLTASPTSSDPLSTFSYRTGDFMQSLPVTVPLGGVSQLTSANSSQVQSSQFDSYPWDHYTIPNYLAVEVTTPGEPKPATCVYVSSQAEGWSATIVAQPTANNVFDMTLWRSNTVLVYNYFMMALVWTLAVAGLGMAIMLVLRDRDLEKKEKIEVDVFIYLAALLFAFPLIRQTLPGAPPFGTLVDIVSYFWAEVIVAGTLLAMVIVWIVREDHRHRDHVRRRHDAAATDGGGAGPGPSTPQPTPET